MDQETHGLLILNMACIFFLIVRMCTLKWNVYHFIQVGILFSASLYMGLAGISHINKDVTSKERAAYEEWISEMGYDFSFETWQELHHGGGKHSLGNLPTTPKQNNQ